MPSWADAGSVTTELQKAVQGLYDAVVMPETWQRALTSFARATNSVGCLLYPQNQEHALAHLPVSPDIQEFIAAYVNEGWYQVDVRAERGWPLAIAGKTIITDDDITSVEERRSSAYYQEFHRAWKLPDWAAIGFAAGGGHWCMPLLRSEGQGPISREQARELSAISSHLGRVVDLATLLSSSRTAEHLAVLNRSGSAAVLLNWNGGVTGLTPMAETMLGVDLYVESGSLVARHLPSNDALQKLLRIAVAGPAAKAACESVVIERLQKRPLVIRAIPLSGILSDAFGRSRALLLITDIDKKKRPAGEIIKRVFGLTAAEARLAAKLGSGGTVEEAAASLEISKETARSQLKSIFQKTRVHRQSELVALLAQLT